MATDRPEPRPAPIPEPPPSDAGELLEMDADEEEFTREIDTTCKKCGETWNGKRLVYVASGDYLKVTCRRCGFWWNELPLDVSDKSFEAHRYDMDHT